MTQVLRIPAILLIIHSLGVSQVQTPVPVQEPPEQAKKLLLYAAQIDADAQRARLAGQQRILHFGGDNTPEASAEQLINQRTSTNNGIYVDTPKVYDDSLLQQMLNSAQSRLVALQGFDQAGLSHAIGSVTGANQQIASFGISGGVQPPVQVTSYGNITSPFPPPSGAASAPTTTLPSSPTPSASDILDEQLQVTSQITNLRLLLEGALSDQIMVGRDETFAKPRVTLGFPVVISPEKRYKNAVAIVEVLVETDSQNDASRNGEPPSITALLPQEKTYNVAAISDKSISIGAGIATATAGASANFIWGHKQYFIVKDQDTLAFQFDPSDSEIALLSQQQSAHIEKRRVRAFAWQFRPVLGRPFVQAGMRQVFVQLAFPGRRAVPAVKSFGTVRIRTYWRRVDPKTGILTEIVPGSLSESTNATPIPNYDMRQRWGAVASFNPTELEDLGSGKMLIKLEGRLLPGTYLRIGSNILQPGAAGLPPSDLKTTRFVANISDLAALKTFVISRDGTEYPLKIAAGNLNQFRVENHTVTTLDDSTVLLSVPISHFDPANDIPPVLLIGGKVFGYSDAPIDRNCNPAAGTCVLSVALPKDFLAANPVVSVKALMLDEDGMVQSNLAATRTFTVFPQSAAPENLVLASFDTKTATYFVYGHDLDQASIIWPARNVDPTCPANQLCMKPMTNGVNDNTLRVVQLPLDFAKESGSLVMQRAGINQHPYVIAVPPLPPSAAGTSAAAAPAGPKFQERIVVGANEGTIVGDKLDSIVSAAFGDKPLTIVDKTPTTLKLKDLATTGASAVAKTEQIVLTNQAGKHIKVPLEVVSVRVEVLKK